MGDFLARRAAMLFLGIAILSFLARDAPASILRNAIAIAFAVMLLGLAATGLYEYARGYAGPGIWIAIVTEVAFAVAFWRSLAH